MSKTKDPYKVDRSFLTPPTQSLYQDHDIAISSADWIQDLLEDAVELDKNIEGDFDYLIQIIETTYYKKKREREIK